GSRGVSTNPPILPSDIGAAVGRLAKSRPLAWRSRRSAEGHPPRDAGGVALCADQRLAPGGLEPTPPPAVAVPAVVFRFDNRAERTATRTITTYCHRGERLRLLGSGKI